jgi:nucleotide-binding universal stress UspA family protein
MDESPRERASVEAERSPIVVVGIDGSDESSAALRWAAEEARLRGAVLKVVSVWHLPTAGYMAVPISMEDTRAATVELIDQQIKEVLGATPDPTLREVREGSPAPQLLDAAKGASQIVVGSRGRGGFSGLLLGSVSAQVAHHAPCPVTIVRN